MKTLFAALCAGALFGLAGCQATLYHPVTGNKLFDGVIEDNPSRERAAELFDLLEDGLQANLVAMRQAITSNNVQAVNICMDNIEKGAKWKDHLAAIIAA